MKKFFILTIFFIFLSCANNEQSVQASKQDKESSEDGLICKYEEITGSHVRKRICYTKRQMDRQRETAQEALRRSSGGVPSNPNP